MADKILITGANGYIGTHLVKECLDAGYDVIATDINSCNIDPRVVYIKYDIKKINFSINLYELFQKPNICIHLAWSDNFNHNSINHINNLPFHFQFLTTLIDQGVAHLTVAGSFREYGNIEGCAYEEIITIPNNFYSLAKIALKDALNIYLKDKNTCFQWLRLFTVYGNDHQNNSLFSKILKWEEEGRKTFPFTDGSEAYDYIHIDDLTKQIMTIIFQKNIQGIINCCSGYPIKIKTKVEEFLNMHQLQIKPKYGAFSKRPYDSNTIFGDNTKIKQIMTDNHNY